MARGGARPGPLPDAFYPARPQVASEAPRPVISGDAHHECRLVWGKQHCGTPRNTVSAERKDVTVRTLALSPQKDQSCREAKEHSARHGEYPTA